MYIMYIRDFCISVCGAVCGAVGVVDVENRKLRELMIELRVYHCTIVPFHQDIDGFIVLLYYSYSIHLIEFSLLVRSTLHSLLLH